MTTVAATEPSGVLLDPPWGEGDEIYALPAIYSTWILTLCHPTSLSAPCWLDQIQGQQNKTRVVDEKEEWRYWDKYSKVEKNWLKEVAC